MTRLDWERVHDEDLIKRRNIEALRQSEDSPIRSSVEYLTELNLQLPDQPTIKCYDCSAMIPKGSLDQHIEVLHRRRSEEYLSDYSVLGGDLNSGVRGSLNIVFSENYRNLAQSLRGYIIKFGFLVRLVRRSAVKRCSEFGSVTFTEQSSNQRLDELYSIIKDLQGVFPLKVANVTNRKETHGDPTIWLSEK